MVEAELGARQPFEFVDCVELREMLGLEANDEQDLLEHLEQVPVDSIYYHTCGYFLRHKYIAGSYPNDFATWAAIQVRDRVLGERLAILDPFEYDDLEALRADLIAIISDHLSRLDTVPRVIYGESFYFMRSAILAVPTGVRAWTLKEFRDALAAVDVSAIYYHLFEARRRTAKGQNDFALWFAEGLGLPELAERLQRRRFYYGSLEDARQRILEECDQYLAEMQVKPKQAI